ncbi:hypothetical protein HF394_12855 [Planococcus glaciei]|uniref:Uncharacterized protein n=1 Tax=Planococcus glaciei TaxID=459472 RepID=A0A7H8Q560_9BACL|nr:hypothetical protein [Planococcus glaciei]QKX49077.1 hypothetical protein HF394_12855 [Planococcus glaciei]
MKIMIKLPCAAFLFFFFTFIMGSRVWHIEGQWLTTPKVTPNPLSFFSPEAYI